VDDCQRALLLSLRALSALAINVLIAYLPDMEYAILPEKPRQLPRIRDRSLLGGGAMRGEDCHLEKLGKFSVDDSMGPADCSMATMHDLICDHS